MWTLQKERKMCDQNRIKIYIIKISQKTNCWIKRSMLQSRDVNEKKSVPHWLVNNVKVKEYPWILIPKFLVVR